MDRKFKKYAHINNTYFSRNAENERENESVRERERDMDRKFKKYANINNTYFSRNAENEREREKS